jgi:hypothetical protein
MEASVQGLKCHPSRVELISITNGFPISLEEYRSRHQDDGQSAEYARAYTVPESVEAAFTLARMQKTQQFQDSQ